VSVLAWLEQLPLSVWLNESPSIWSFPMFLFAHILGMSIVAGGASMICLALLGIWPHAPLKPLSRLLPILVWAFVLNAVTGLAIFMKDATTYGRNTDLYVKLVFVFAGMWLVRLLRTRVFEDPRLDQQPLWSGARVIAWASLVCWFGAIVSGRLIAYVGPVAGLL
jgi:hypothetical protein